MTKITDVMKILIVFIIYYIWILLNQFINDSLLELITLIIFNTFIIVIYINVLKKEIKYIKKYKFNLLEFIFCIVLLLIFNHIYKISNILELINVMILLPVLEEILFKIPFKNIFKNKYIFIMFTSIYFTLFKLAFIGLDFNIFYIMQIFLISLYTSYLYKKHSNIYISIIARIVLSLGGLLI